MLSFNNCDYFFFVKKELNNYYKQIYKDLVLFILIHLTKQLDYLITNEI